MMKMIVCKVFGGKVEGYNQTYHDEDEIQMLYERKITKWEKAGYKAVDSDAEMIVLVSGMNYMFIRMEEI